MKKNNLIKTIMALSVMIITLCIFSFASADTTWSKADQPTQKDDCYERYNYTYIEKISGPTYKDDNEFVGEVVNKSSSNMSETKTINADWHWSGNVSGDWQALQNKLEFSGGVEGGQNFGDTDSYTAEAKPHTKVIITKRSCVVEISMTIVKTLQRAPLSDPDAFVDVETVSSGTKVRKGNGKSLTGEEVWLDHEIDNGKPKVRNADGVYTHYYCRLPGCPVPNGKIEIENGDHTCVHAGQTCSKPGTDCPTCGRYGTPTGCVFNYSQPYGPVGWGSYISFLCTNYDGTANGCWETETHYHTFDCSYPVKLPEENEFRQIQGDFEKHEQKFMEPRGCSYEHCDDIRDFEVWLPRKHSWKLIESKSETCIHDGYEKWQCADCELIEHIIVDANGDHDYDYKNPKPVANDVVSYYCLTPGCEDHVEHSHHFISDGPKPTNDTQIIPDNYSKHKRKYVEHKVCDGEHCNEPRTIETWQEETHSWRNEVRKEATCLKDGSITHICAGCEMVETIPIQAFGRHDPDYDHPIEYSEDEIRYPCKRSGCNEIAEFHRHTFSDNGDPKPQNKYLKITGDSKNHKRLYLQPRKCSCGETRDFEKYIVESHSGWSVKERKSATCLEDGYVIEKCGKCDFEKTIGENSRGGHTYDYAHPENPSANPVKFPCIYGCPNAYATHSHNYVDAGDGPVKTGNLQKNNATYHKRRYDIKQVCNKKLGNGAACGASPKYRYDWRDEKHTSMILTEKKDATCTANGYKKYKCSDNCGYTRTDTINALGHVYDYSRREGTSTGYRFPCKYGCAGAYDYHSHSFEDDKNKAPVKTGDLQKSDATYHKRKYEIKQVCNKKLGNGATCGAPKSRYEWRNETHTFSNNGPAQPTSTYQQIPGNATQHKRRYIQPKICACGHTKDEETWPLEAHPSWHNDILLKAANCSEQGARTRMCTACDYVDTYATPKDLSNHAYGGWVVAQTPTAKNPGKLKRTCSRCGMVHYKNM